MDVIFDIDGTLADASHRLHWIQDTANWIQKDGKLPRPNWEEFLSPQAVAKDAIIEPIWKVMRGLLNGGARVLFITGRSESLRQTTQDWLTSKECPIRAHTGWMLTINSNSPDKTLPIYMRPQGSRKPSHETKEQGLFQARFDGFDPKLVFEDRADDTAMWRRNGLICCQVAEGFY